MQLAPAHRQRFLFLAVALWLCVVGVGWYALTASAFKGDGGLDARYAVAWPGESSLPRDADGPTLVAFLHPKCPCSWAVLSELEQILDPDDHKGPPPWVIVDAVLPSEGADDWAASPQLARARETLGATIVIDRGGREARRFGASTSGTVMLFAADGTRRFGGGVNIARGHEGTSVGSQTLARLLADESLPPERFPVWGCDLAVEPAPLASIATGAR